jgi:hypothetical protein
MHIACKTGWTSGPKQKDRRHSSYGEDTDEPAPTIENEPTDIEREIPADDTEPVERVKDQNEVAPPAFEE